MPISIPSRGSSRWLVAMVMRALNALRHPTKRLMLYTLSLVAAGVIGAFVSLPIQDWWSSRKPVPRIPHPFVAVVLSNDDPNFTIPMELKQGIQQAMNSRPSIETPDRQSVAIEFVPTALTPEDTANAVRTRCLEKPDCIAVVGASDSTTTTAALKEILKFQGQKPTLIMPIATATSLTEIAARGSFSQILRLVPNNNEQALDVSFP